MVRVALALAVTESLGVDDWLRVPDALRVRVGVGESDSDWLGLPDPLRVPSCEGVPVPVAVAGLKDCV